MLFTVHVYTMPLFYASIELYREIGNSQIFGGSLELPMQFIVIFGHFFGRWKATVQIRISSRADTYMELIHM